MGKPAARMGDMTAHGGSIVLGNPMVLIGKMPASAMGDMHVCPMVTGVVPHVGGPITLGSTGVFIGKKPAARLGDITVCVGPPSMPVLGCMTVLLGEVGSGSAAGSAASAAAAAAAKTKDPLALSPFPLSKAPPSTENHSLECLVVDSAGHPLGGVKYKVTDPDNNVIIGVTSVDGRVSHGGYAKSGSFKIELQDITDVKWEKDKGKIGDTVKMKAKADGFDDGQEAYFSVFEEAGANEYRLAKLIPTKVQGGKLEGSYKLGERADGAGPAPGAAPKVLGFFFMAYVEGMVGVSNHLKVSDTFEMKLVDGDGKGVKDVDYELTLADGSIKKGSLDGSGKAQLQDLPSGPVTVKWKRKKK